MTKEMLLVIVIAIGALLLALMVVGWFGRRRRQSGIAAPAPRPEDVGIIRGRFEGKYVATTLAGQPYERVTVHGLAFRGPMTAVVAERGIVLERTGETDIWIAAADLRDVRAATWTIDRVVERDGLTLLEWELPGVVVDLYLRVEQAAEFEAALSQLRQASGKAS